MPSTRRPAQTSRAGRSTPAASPARRSSLRSSAAFIEPGAVLSVVPDGLHVWLGSTLGCLALGMIHQLSGGAWGSSSAAPIGAASRMLPVVTLLFLPLVVRHAAPVRVDARRRGRADDAAAAQGAVPERAVLPRRARRSTSRSGTRCRTSSTAGRSSRTGPATRGVPRRMQVLSGGGLLAYGLTITFASFDWVMSLDPHWFSTIYGVLVMGGQGLTAMAFADHRARVAEPPASRSTAIVVPAHFHDLGNCCSPSSCCGRTSRSRSS